ncbi:MAG: hypothetical protein FWB74_06120 [Defluviitaleaceae bacterium]|nr:hypothetical protein [Defluviitaleaceae bacterium]
MVQNQQNPFGLWTQLTKNMMDSWSEFAEKSMAGMPSVAGMPNFTFNFPGAEFPWMQMSADSNPMEMFYKPWIDGMKNMASLIPNPAVKDGFNRMMNSMAVYNGLQNYWEKMQSLIPTDMKNWDAFQENVLGQYQDFAKGFSSWFMPDQLKDMFAMPMENLTAINQSLMAFFKPWAEDSATLMPQLVRALQGDRDAYQEFLKEWANVYKDSVGKMLNVPAVGSNRASVEKMMKMLDAYVSLVVLVSELNSELSGVMQGSMERLMARLAELHAEGKQPQTFMEFYKLWSSFNEQSFAEMYSADGFVRVMNDTVATSSKLQIMVDDFVQDMLAHFPIASNRELDEVGIEVYELRKRMNALEKKMKALETGEPADTKAKK